MSATAHRRSPTCQSLTRPGSPYPASEQADEESETAEEPEQSGDDRPELSGNDAIRGEVVAGTGETVPSEYAEKGPGSVNEENQAEGDAQRNCRVLTPHGEHGRLLFSLLIRAYRRARLIQGAVVCRVEAVRHVTEKEGAGCFPTSASLALQLDGGISATRGSLRPGW